MASRRKDYCIQEAVTRKQEAISSWSGLEVEKVNHGDTGSEALFQDLIPDSVLIDQVTRESRGRRMSASDESIRRGNGEHPKLEEQVTVVAQQVVKLSGST